jgi:hypothetical protein
MDSVSRDARREALHEKIENAQATLRRAAAAAVIQNDPLSEQTQGGRHFDWRACGYL